MRYFRTPCRGARVTPSPARSSSSGGDPHPVKPAPFGYADPASVEEALDLLAAEGEGAKVLAGGQSLLPLLSMRLAAPTTLVDINRIPGLDRIDVTPDGVRVGALVRHAALLGSTEAAAVQ